jgi:hypothetical protein
MVYNKQTTFETEHYRFGDTGDTAPKVSRNIQRELKNEILDTEKEISTFEQARGIARKPRVKMDDYQFNNIVLSPESEKDKGLLNKLLNDPNYIITYWKDNWTPQGNYTMFIIYGKKKEKNEQQG